MPYVNARWLGGMMTNFVTIRSRVNRMEELEFQAHLQILAGNAEELPMSEIMKLREMR